MQARGSPLRVFEDRFRVMGTTAHVVVTDCDHEAIDGARAQLTDLEAKWSRFRPESELSRLNALAGRPVVVSPLTFELIELACRAWNLTGGLFDPTTLNALVAAGYDRDFDALEPNTAVDPPAAAPTPGCAAIELDPLVGSVRLPADVALDFGGIAKGFAADLVAQQLVDDGAVGACVSIGGDLRVIGQPPTGEAWVISIDAEAPGVSPPPSLMLAAGGVATSSRARRSWTRGSHDLHHLIDPRTGAPARSSCVSATVLAGRAVDAEPLAKAALLEPDAASELLVSQEACGLVVSASGAHSPLGAIDGFFAP
jgi:thiamine biosynthesis lipoprotein